MSGRRTMERPWNQTIRHRGVWESALTLRVVWEGDRREAKVRTGLGKAHRLKLCAPQIYPDRSGLEGMK